MTRRGVKLLIAGTVVMIAGYILMTGPSPVRDVFNYSMFDWRRTVAAPIVILAGVVVIIAAVMGCRSGRKEDK